MNRNLLKVIAACVALGSTMAFAQNHKKTWYQAVTQRNRTGSTHHHTARDYQRDQSYMEGLRRHHEWARLAEFQRREGYPMDAPRHNDREHHDNGLHKGWTKGRHNPHHGRGPGHYSG
jgi:hypothetical protein